MPTIAASALEGFARKLLSAGGATKEEAEATAAGLIGANLRGYESHGVMRIPFYLDMLKTEEIVSGAELTILSESPSRVVADANWGFGAMQAARLQAMLSERARREGIGIGTLLHCGHIGRLGEYCEQAATAGLVSMVMVNSHGGAVRVAPPGGRAPRLSTNPLAIGAPNGDEPLILDFSTSATAEGKVRVKKIAGEQCPEGWLIDNQGRATTDPNDLYGDPPGAILPMGGAQAYKGFGLGIMVEILTGALSGGECAREVPYPKKGNCVFMLLMDPAQFGGADHFAAQVKQLSGYLRSCPRAEGCERIMLPGDPERMVYAKRATEGIFLDAENWSQLVKLAERLSVALPATK